MGGILLLHITLAPACRAASGSLLAGAMTREIVMKLADGATGRTIDALLTARYGPAARTVCGTNLRDLRPGTWPLVTGAVIFSFSEGDSPIPADIPRARRVHSNAGSAPLLLVVCGGPDAGVITELHRGTYTIGRLLPTSKPAVAAAPNSGLDRAARRIGISDPALSREHAQLTVGTDSVQLRDLDSANGTWVAGRRVRTTVLDTGMRVKIGYSTCRLVVPAPAAPPVEPPENLFDPLPVRLQEPVQKTGMLLTGALLPLILGVVLAVATGLWMFLAFSGVSAVTALIAVAGSRRQRRWNAANLADAVAEDGRRRKQAAPDPGAAALTAARYGPDAVPGSAAPPGTTRTRPEATRNPEGRMDGAGGPAPVIPLRLGTANQPANVETVPAQPRFTPPQVPDAPVVLAIGQDLDVSLAGPAAEDLHRTILIQASYAATAGLPVDIICAGAAEDLERPARFLPGVRLLALPDASPAALAVAAARLYSALDGTAAGAGHPAAATVLTLCGPWAANASALRAGLPPRLRSRTCMISVGGSSGGTHVSLAAGRAALTRGGQSLDFLPDLVQSGTFERLCRQLAGRTTAATGPGSGSSLPHRAAFEAFHPGTPELIHRMWEARGQGTVPAPAGAETSVGTTVGVAADGRVHLDLVTDGPHFLVAGTTGSGKSEFLRSFVAGLAASLPPTALNVLLIDFKGGAGLGQLATLPHSVGMLTDFSAENISRALVSLRAEMRRREALLARSGAESLADYNRGRPQASALPRLLVAVDEFRMLADEVPAALPELLRIAAIGRSLGLHLLLATQRPQGAITTDIRANISTSIALRVQSTAESRDVLNSDCAAGIPPDQPGRAFVSRGGRTPVVFQSLSTALGSTAGGGVVQELNEYLADSASGIVPFSPTTADPGALSRICITIREAAARAGCPEPFRPVLQPLPAQLTRDMLGREGIADRESPGVVLGLLDDPARQHQRILSWHPERDTHLAILGTARAGTTDSLAGLMYGHLMALPGRHFYVLDAEGSLSWLSECGQTGAYVSTHETARAARVLSYLSSEVARRLSSVPGSASGPGITLVITGWARWCGLFRSRRGLSGEEDLADLIRDGERADVCIVLSGDREILNARFFPQVPNRLFFPADATPETLLLWPRLPPMDRIRGRALVQGRIGTSEGLAAQLLRPDLPPENFPPLPLGSPAPHRVENLPVLVSPAALALAPSPELVPVGVSGDELLTAYVRIPARSVFVVAGPRGSGRTSFLRQLGRSAHPSLMPMMAAGGDQLEQVLAASSRPAEELARMLVLVDDADDLPGAIHQKLAGLQASGARLVLAVLPGAANRIPAAMQLRSAPRGALLCPTGTADGDIFGIRVNPDARPPAGRCYLVEGPEVQEAQAAYDPS